MEKTFDLIVIGTGSAGTAAASRCRSAGWEVAIIDSRPFGGTCALRGCDPKKVLVGAAEVTDWARRVKGNGILSNAAEIDWSSLMRFKKTFTDPVPRSKEKEYAKAGIKAFHGRTRFVGHSTLEVEGDTLTGRHILIAAGAKPVPLGIPGEAHVITSDQFLELEQLPKRIIFVGGGYISFEFAHVAARAGAKIQILHSGSRPLEGFDGDLVEGLARATRDLGVDIHLNTTVKEIKHDGMHFSVETSTNNAAQDFEADMVVHGAGRVPDIDDMDLKKAGVDRDKKGVVVNQFLQSVSAPAVYAAGDAASTAGLPLTPVASMEGRIAAANLLKGNHQKPDYTGVSSVVFTVPPLAYVGLGEEAAKKQGLKFKVNREDDTSDWYSSRRVGEKYSGYKVLVEEDSGRIIGAHLLGPHAEEVINLFAFAIRFGLKAEDLKTMIYSYPSSSSDISSMV